MSTQPKRRGTSTKPCHGCGSTDMHWTNQVCDECAQALREHAEMVKRRDECPDTVVMMGKAQAHALPWIPKLDSEQCKPIQAGFHALQEAMSEQCGYAPYSIPRIFPTLRASSSSNDWNQTVRIRPDVAAALGSTYKAVADAVAAAHKKGHEEGRNLLAQLASGQITTDDFNNTAARVDGKQE